MPTDSELTEVYARLQFRVEQGIKVLVNHFGGYQWVSEIDPDRVVMYDMFRCILGRLFGSFSVGMDLLGLTTHLRAKDLGFDADVEFEKDYDVSMDVQYRMLDVIWTEKLRELA